MEVRRSKEGKNISLQIRLDSHGNGDPHLVNIHDSKGEIPVIKRLAGRFSELKSSMLMVAIEARWAEFVKGLR